MINLFKLHIKITKNKLQYQRYLHCKSVPRVITCLSLCPPNFVLVFVSSSYGPKHNSKIELHALGFASSCPELSPPNVLRPTERSRVQRHNRKAFLHATWAMHRGASRRYDRIKYIEIS